MTKSKSGMVIRGIPHLATNTLPVPVIQSVFSLLPLGRYLLSLTTLNRYQPINSSEKFFFTTTPRNVSIVRYRMSLVAILPLDFVMIHWIRWIQRKSFRENSINSVWSHCEWMWLAHFGGQWRENCITLFDSLQLVPRNIILHYRVNSSWHQHLLPIYFFENMSTYFQEQLFCLISKINWPIILCFSQLFMTLIGFLANLATLIVLKKNISIFSRVFRLLLINQSLIDSVACLFADVLILQVRWFHSDSIVGRFWKLIFTVVDFYMTNIISLTTTSIYYFVLF